VVRLSLIHDSGSLWAKILILSVCEFIVPE
jgi:hypothetical protein